MTIHFLLNKLTDRSSIIPMHQLQALKIISNKNGIICNPFLVVVGGHVWKAYHVSLSGIFCIYRASVHASHCLHLYQTQLLNDHLNQTNLIGMIRREVDLTADHSDGTFRSAIPAISHLRTMSYKCLSKRKEKHELPFAGNSICS